MKARIKITIAALSLLLGISSAQDALQPNELQTEISNWRTNTLPSLEADHYWIDLKALGQKVGEDFANSIVESQVDDIDSAIALMAYQAWSRPKKIDEIGGWYGVSEGQVSRELRGVESDEIWEAMQDAFNRKRATGLIERLREEHMRPEFTHAWEAWMLSPPSPKRGQMRQRMNEALAAVGDERTIALLVEKCRILPEHRFRQENPEQRQEAIRNEAGEIRAIIRAIGGKAAVLALLECARIAEERGDGGEEPDSVRDSITRILSSSYNPRQLREMPEWAETLRDPENPTQWVPWDDKWKEFKPIIEELLEDPGDLSPEDIQTLRAALAAMPE